MSKKWEGIIFSLQIQKGHWSTILANFPPTILVGAHLCCLYWYVPFTYLSGIGIEYFHISLVRVLDQY
jgi:hypothetical protein